MRNVAVLGGGPAGLYAAILIKKRFPETDIQVTERNRADDTFGWGVVFSDETLANFESADAETFHEISRAFRRWTTIETHVGGAKTVSTGHGFAAISRQTLLGILQARCRALSVRLEFQREFEASSLSELRVAADLIIAADGANSAVRGAFAHSLGASVTWGRCKFAWLGTDAPLDAFTFVFEPSRWGLFQVHAYPFSTAPQRGTWIVECAEDVWRSAGLDRASEDDTVAFCQSLFSAHLKQHRLYSNRSLWRSFPTVRCTRWLLGNVVLLGDAAHTAHFSIGSGTKLAMEDAIALAAALPSLKGYEATRRPVVERLQRAAEVSRRWFENAARYVRQEPTQFTFNLMTRSHRITYDNLAARDPALVARLSPDGPPILRPLTLRGLTLPNRVGVSPMCQYSAVDGAVNDWHLVHLGARALGGAGLVMGEMTDVEADGRITHGCAGLYRAEHAAAWKRIVDFVHGHSPAKIGLQLAHAGRKGSARHPWVGPDIPLTAEEGAWQTVGPSAQPFALGWPAPREMDRADMDRVVSAFVRAALWADEAGFDLIELHAAHGYLLSSFLSPLANLRTDAYGGSLENRQRFPLEVVRAVRAAWPEEKPLAVRISATDWFEDDGAGTTVAESIETARALAAAGCDLVDVSTAGNSPLSKPEFGRMYQVPFADAIRQAIGAAVPVASVGGILSADDANTVLAAGRADYVFLARAHLADPYLTSRAAANFGLEPTWPGQYDLAKPLLRGRPKT